MGKRKLQGKTETITYSEAQEMESYKLNEIIAMFVETVNQIPDDRCNEEEKATCKINFAMELGELTGITMLKGLLMDPDEFVAKLPYNDGVKVVSDN